jgi:hypothetical protein
MSALKAAYGVSELAELSGMSRHQVYRLVTARLGLRSERPYAKLMIPLTSFQEAFPEIWESILLRASLGPDND